MVEQDGYLASTAISKKGSFPAPMGKVTSKIFFTRKKHHILQPPAYQVRCMQGTPYRHPATSPLVYKPPSNHDY